jgi:serine/threonine protein kinase
MKLVRGPDLTRALKERGPFPWEEVLQVVCDVAVSLDYAHGQQIVRCELEPRNFCRIRRRVHC